MEEVAAVGGVDGDRDAPDHGDPEPAEEEFQAVREHQAHPIALFNPKGPQSSPNAPRPLVDLGIGEDLPRALETGPPRPGRRLSRQELPERGLRLQG